MRKRKSSLVAIREVSDINLTPMMDLTFILLITFIITFPMIEQGISVKLPSAKSGQLKASKDAHDITVDVLGNLFLDGQPIEKQELAQQMKTVADDNPEAPIYVRADLAVNYGRVAEVMVLLNAAGINTMALVTQAEE